MELLTLMNFLRNHFILERTAGAFHIQNGQITPAPFQTPAPYLLTAHQLHPMDEKGAYPTLPDGDRHLTLYACHPPAALLTLLRDITAWEAAQGERPVQAEALGEYKVTYAPGPGNWQQAFATRLTPYRRMFQEVMD